MFESRLRQSQKGGLGLQNRFATTSRIYRVRAHAFVLQRNKENGAVHAKRAHAHALALLRLQHSKMVDKIESCRYDDDIDDANIDDFLVEMQSAHELTVLERNIQKMESVCPEKQWYDRVGSLKPDHVASLAVLNAASGNSEQQFPIDPERCNCGRLFRLDPVLHINRCKVCKECYRVLNPIEDVASENIMQKMPANINQQHRHLMFPLRRINNVVSNNHETSFLLTHNNNNTPTVIMPINNEILPKRSREEQDVTKKSNREKRLCIQDSREIDEKQQQQTLSIIPSTINRALYIGNDEDDIQNKALLSSGGMRIGRGAAPMSAASRAAKLASFRKYLQQYAPDAPEPSKALWAKLYEALASVHLFSSLRCKGVPVAKILKDTQFQAFASQAQRLTKLFNGDPIPVLPHDLIERLLLRLQEILAVVASASCATLLTQSNDGSGNTSSKVSLPGDEILTHILLLSENRPDLASAFTTYKTINVTQAQTQKFIDIVQVVAQNSSFSWRVE